MNLVQIQERLKDMPLQAVMQYANGMNPEVPPYLALGELNRRKKMEQAMQPAEMPQGTVKEQLEQEVGLAALQKQLMNQLQTQGLRQQQAAMSQGQQMANMPGPAPQGVPQPEVPEEMASGGITTINVPDNQFEFGSGGIIAFKEGGDKGRRIPASELDIDPYGISEAGTEAYLSKLVKDLEEKEREKQVSAKAAEIPEGMAEAVREGRVLTTNPITPDRGFPDNRGSAQRFPPGPPPAPATPSAAPAPARQTVAAPPQGIATVAPQAVAYPQAGPMQQALAAMATGPQAPYPSYEQMRKEAETKDEYLTKRPGEKLEQYLATLERRDREDQERFQEMEKERTRGALWKSLMAAGEASRGQRGIGALLGGFGRTSETEMEAARGREEKQRALMREREMNRVKMAQEIESARIAASEGRFKDQREHEQKAAQYNQENKKIDVQLATTQAGIEAAQQGRQFEVNAANARTFAQLQAQAAEGKLDRENRVLVANIQAASANRPGEAERIFDEYQRRLKADPSGKMAEEYMTAIQRAKGLDIRAGDAKTRQIAAQMKPVQEELEKLIANPMSMKDPRVQQLRSELDKLRQQLGGSQAGTDQRPITVIR
jgi:hypothetical protein